MAKESWSMKGELVLACNCKVFCPCVLSLGDHPPSEGYCQTWAGFRIDDGHFGDVDLSGIFDLAQEAGILVANISLVFSSLEVVQGNAEAAANIALQDRTHEMGVARLVSEPLQRRSHCDP